MTSLGPDWRHDKLCRCYGVPDLLQVPSPSSCGWVLTAEGSADTVWVSTLRFARGSFPFGPGFVAWWCFLQLELRSTLHYETHKTAPQTLRQSLLPQTRTHISHNFGPHLRKLTKRKNNQIMWPEIWYKICNKINMYHWIFRNFTRLLYSQQKCHAHTKLKPPTTHCLPACDK